MMSGRIALVLAVASILITGCYVPGYYDDYYYGYRGDYEGSYYPRYPAVEYYSPVKPIVDLAILGAVLYGWSHWHPRYYRAPSSGGYRIRR
jgi:hypothetical protein